MITNHNKHIFQKNTTKFKLSIFIIIISLLLISSKTQSCDSTICNCINNQCKSCLYDIFYYNSTSLTCTLCPYQCKNCTVNQQCIACQQMYYLSTINSTKQCLSCPKYCKTCISSDICSTCIDGYVLQSNQCQKCQIRNAQTCQSLMTVKTCELKYWKNGDSCSSCRQFCELCTSSNNCLKCQSGYRPRVSAGTYCVACDNGCKTCTDTTCTQCFFNYRLVNRSCQSIQSNCSQINNCSKCQFTNNIVKCLLCKYPYYLSAVDNTCKIGSSILCKYSIGSSPYQCINECSDISYQSTTTSLAISSMVTVNKNINQIICFPNLWIESTVIEQLYYNAIYIKKYGSLFTPANMTVVMCSSIYIYSRIYTSGRNILKFSYVFKPYYKLNIMIKFLSIYKSSSNNSISSSDLSFSVKFSDNSTTNSPNISNSYTFNRLFSSSSFSSCLQNYLTFQSRIIKDQLVTIQLSPSLFNITSNTFLTLNDNQLLNTFPTGIIGYQQVLIQYYRCDSKCRICSNSKYCIECYSLYFQSSNTCVNRCQGLFEFYIPNGNYQNFTSKYCVQECKDGYYSTTHPLKNNTFICLKCPSKCTKCKSQTQCLSCNSPYLFYSNNFSCIQSCPNTHFVSISTNQCKLCNAPCKTCLNETKCLSCFIGYYDGNNCVGICPVGTYSSVVTLTKQCLSCDPKCNQCQNSPTFCSVCKSSYKLLGTNCLDSCPNQTHYQYSNKCYTCKSPCILCSSQTQCITCSRGYLFNKTCLFDCPSTYYKDISNNKCNKCENNCQTCISISNCKTCVKATYLYNSMCLSECPIKTYISANNVCIPCIPPCLTCNNQTSCITCLLGYLSNVTANKCVTNCESGYFGVNSNQTCQKCATNCKTCKQQATFCLSCYNNLLLENNKCVVNCSKGSYSFNNQRCRPCSYPCLTCIDLSSKCLSCYQPFILSNDNKCSLRCLNNQYQKNGSCLDCQYPCSSCIDLNICTSCQLNSIQQTYLIQGICKTQCPEGMYADPVSLKCKSCIFPCQTCRNSRQCTTCISGYLNQQKKICQICSSLYYPDQTSKTCKLCSLALSNCLQCQTQSICKICQNGYVLLNNICISQTQCSNTAGYYLNSRIKKCILCVLPCKNCLNPTTCITCQNGFLYQGKCLFVCPDGFYIDKTLKKCVSCNYTLCKTCENTPNQCISCFQNSTLNVFLMENKTCIKEVECGATYYLDKTFGYFRCLKCISPCQKCKSASVCQSCISGVLYKGTCSFSCPNKFYAYENVVNTTVTIPTCQQCSTSCLQCSTKAQNCISCPITQYLQNNQCVTQCSPKYYLNQYISECLKCQSPCKQCISAAYCISCENSSLILYYGTCVTECPEGTYFQNQTCVNCPKQCQICQFSLSLNKVYCKKCALNLFMNSTQQGKCQTSCTITQYPDTQTRKCYQCQIPCESCLTATKCKTCISGYLVYKNQCWKGQKCLKNTFKSPFEQKCLDNCDVPYYGDYFTQQCSLECQNNYLKVPIQKNRICAQKCPSNYYVDKNHLCQKCVSDICDNLLTYEVYIKSIFNTLYVKIKFSKEILIDKISKNNIKLIIVSITQVKSAVRLLTVSNQTGNQYDFTITESTSQALWLKVNTFQTLNKSSVLIQIDSYYLFSPKSSQPLVQFNLQNLNQSTFLQKFDQYSLEQKQSGISYQTFSKLLSFILVSIIVIGLFGNCLSLFYQLIDYFQILFMILFLQIDYPPSLNYFLYGFRYSHYLFLPDIFRPTTPKQYSQLPGKFGIILPDADFLSNTGHDFLIIFICIGLIIIIKLLDFLLSGNIKNNKIANDPIENNNQIKQEKNQHDKKSEDQQNKSHEQKTSAKKQQIDTLQQEQINKQKQKLHNIIQYQILVGKHGCLPKYLKIIISRFKWNYFNDISYCLYFYIILCSYSHLFIIAQAQGFSDFFAIIGILLSVGLPGFFIYLLYKNDDTVSQHYKKKQIYLPFKTFYYFTSPNSLFSLYQIPIKYIRKLVIAILLVYCSQYPQFVLGVILMISLVNMVLMALYSPFILKFQIYIHLFTQFIFCIAIFALSLMQIDYLNFSTFEKLMFGKIIVGLIIILTIILVLWNLIRLIVQIIKEINGKDYFINYYKQNTQIQSISEASAKKSVTVSVISNQKVHQQSNVRLHENLQANYKNNESQSRSYHYQDQYSALDIYLKKQADAPPILIKCIKNLSQEQDKSEQQKEEENSQSQSNSQQFSQMGKFNMLSSNKQASQTQQVNINKTQFNDHKGNMQEKEKNQYEYQTEKKSYFEINNNLKLSFSAQNANKINSLKVINIKQNQNQSIKQIQQNQNNEIKQKNDTKKSIKLSNQNLEKQVIQNSDKQQNVNKNVQVVDYQLDQQNHEQMKKNKNKNNKLSQKKQINKSNGKFDEFQQSKN